MRKLIVASLILGLFGCQNMHKTASVSVSGTIPMQGAPHFQMKQYQVAGSELHDQMIFFDLNKNSISASDKEKLQAFAQVVATQPVRIRVEGHTDERGSAEYNIALGWRRAQAVAEYLQSQGVDKKSIWLVSYGKEKPVVYGHNDTAWQMNRRSYVSLVSQEKV